MAARSLGLRPLYSIPFSLGGRPACSPQARALIQACHLSTTPRRRAPTQSTANTEKNPVGSESLSKSINVSAEKGHEILTNQRLNRPVAPHLGVYKLQQTYFGSSAWMRITGCTLSGAAYVYFISYLVAPVFGISIDSSTLVDAFASLPMVIQNGIKFGLGFPFVYHFFNGIKHLIYDAGIGYKKGTIKKADYFLWGISFPVALGLVFGM